MGQQSRRKKAGDISSERFWSSTEKEITNLIHMATKKGHPIETLIGVHRDKCLSINPRDRILPTLEELATSGDAPGTDQVVDMIKNCPSDLFPVIRFMDNGFDLRRFKVAAVPKEGESSSRIDGRWANTFLVVENPTTLPLDPDATDPEEPDPEIQNLRDGSMIYTDLSINLLLSRMWLAGEDKNKVAILISDGRVKVVRRPELAAQLLLLGGTIQAQSLIDCCLPKFPVVTLTDRVNIHCVPLVPFETARRDMEDQIARAVTEGNLIT